MTTEQLVNLRADLRMFAADHGSSTTTIHACNKIELRIKTLLNRRNSDSEDVRAAVMARFDADIGLRHRFDCAAVVRGARCTCNPIAP